MSPRQSRPSQYSCPFEDCPKSSQSYKDISALKAHLRSVREGDENHPKDDGLWKELEEKGYLTIYSRPRNLDDTEKKERRKATDLRRRQKRKAGTHPPTSKLILLKELVDYFESTSRIGETISEWISVAQEQAVRQPQVSFSTFPRLLFHILPLTSFPCIEPPHSPDTPVLSMLPSGTHYRKASLLIHPDKDSRQLELAQALNTAFDLWRPVLQDENLSAVTISNLQTGIFNMGRNCGKLACMYDAYEHEYQNRKVFNMVKTALPSPDMVSTIKELIQKA